MTGAGCGRAPDRRVRVEARTTPREDEVLTYVSPAYVMPVTRKELLVRILRYFIASVLLTIPSLAVAADGLIAIKSPFSAKDTMNRLEDAAKQRGLTIFARIDHAAGATKVGKTLRPTELLIFGNPQGGTPFMECAQSVGIDLPLKALVWEDASSQIWLGYNDPAYLAQRHGVGQCPVIENLRKALSGLAEAAVAR
jgi:uncharacterized protein (DUF302 family)